MFSHSIFRRALVAAGSRAASNFHTVESTPSTTFATSSSSSTSSSFNSSSSSASFQSQNHQEFNNSNNASDESSSYSSSSASNSDENQAALQASATQLMRFRIQKPEQFYFSRGDSICRLCNEFVSSQQVRFHLVGAGPRGPSTHMGREIVLDSLVFYGKLGYDPALVMRSWAFTLLSHPQYVRLPELLPKDPTDLQARAKKCHELLQSLKRLKIIDISVSPHSEVGRTEHATRMAVKRRVAFERLECIGDNAWGSHLSGRMLLLFPDKKWAHAQMHHSFNTFRDLVETNTNLERCFDLLNIAELLPATSRAIVGDGKIKADIFEAILGELNCALYAHEANLWGTSEEYTELNDEHLARTCIIIRHIMNEIFDLTLLSMMYLLGEHAIAIARELSMGNMMNMNVAPSRPPFDAGDTIKTRRPHYHKNYVPSFTVPVLSTPTTAPVAALSANKRMTMAGETQNRNHHHQNNHNHSHPALFKNHKSSFKLYGPAINMTAKSQYVASWKSFAEQDRKSKMQHESRLLAASLTHSNEASLSVTKHKHMSSGVSLPTLMSLTENPIPSSRSLRTSNVKMIQACQPPFTPLASPSSSSSAEMRNQMNSGIADDQHNEPELALDQAVLQQLASPSLELGFAVPNFMSTIINNTSSTNASSSSSGSSSLSSSSPSTLQSSTSSYRSLCPFSKLSQYPPHIYNPYGLDDKTWMKRWMKEEGAKEFFDEDVCDNIGTVLAQFEATAMFGNNSSNHNKSGTSASSQQQQLKIKNLVRGRSYCGLVDHVFEKLNDLEDVYDGDPDDDDPDDDIIDNTPPCEFYGKISYVRDELLEYVHPFKNGVTVGSDGASFTSLSGSINEVTKRVIEGTSDSAGDEHLRGFGRGSGDERNIGGKLDIDEIKRRNEMKTGRSASGGGGRGGGRRRFN